MHVRLLNAKFHYAIRLANQLARWSQTWFPRFELSRHVQLRTGLRPVSELLASRIAPARPNSITLSSSLAGHRPAREPARQLDSVIEFSF